jgi:hypothetical protein
MLYINTNPSRPLTEAQRAAHAIEGHHRANELRRSFFFGDLSMHEIKQARKEIKRLFWLATPPSRVYRPVNAIQTAAIEHDEKGNSFLNHNKVWAAIHKQFAFAKKPRHQSLERVLGSMPRPHLEQILSTVKGV